MRRQMINFMEKASVNMVKKKASHVIFGEKEIPKVILDEIKENTKRK